LHLKTKLEKKGQKKILSIDGGGIRGLIAVEILAKIEQELREREKNPNLVLSDYFDFVAGTSTGAVIAAAISIGKSMDFIRSFYVDNGQDMFSRRIPIPNIGKIMGYEYSCDALTKTLQEVFGKQTTLGSKELKTLLLVVMHNVKTDSPWPMSNNPYAKYNNLEEHGTKSNLHLPLWQLLRASTAAPTFFRPEHIDIGGEPFSFVDGAMTPYNNPAFQAYLMATLNAYNLKWNKREKNLLLVSVGTGETPLVSEKEKSGEKFIYNHVKDIPAYLINAISTQQDMLCRVFGRCKVGYAIDSEIGDLQDTQGLGCVDENLFTYLRYSLKLTDKRFKALGLSHLDADALAQIDAVDNIADLEVLGKRVAEEVVDVGHFEGF